MADEEGRAEPQGRKLKQGSTRLHQLHRDKLQEYKDKSDPQYRHQSSLLSNLMITSSLLPRLFAWTRMGILMKCS